VGRVGLRAMHGVHIIIGGEGRASGGSQWGVSNTANAHDRSREH